MFRSMLTALAVAACLFAGYVAIANAAPAQAITELAAAS
jgi:hypothetical protein